MTGVHEELRRRNRAGARLRLWEAHLIRTAPVTPGCLRVTLGGSGLAPFADGALPADAIKLALPAEPGDDPVVRGTFPNLEFDGPRPAFRPYTVRRFDPVSTELDLDVVLHGDGPGARWARTAVPGQPVRFTGPRSEFWACPDVDAHLLVGDATAAPGAVAILESLPGADARALLQVDGPAERCSDDPRIVWLHDDPVVALRDLALPGGRVQAWVAGEAAMVRDVRRHLLRERGLDRSDLHASGYWRRGMTVTETDAGRMAAFTAASGTARAYDDHHDVDLAEV
ncbi:MULTISPECIES: siderophore-interacting protein [Pseudonocardia]|uniref:Vibriobactin utilization protein ViuB n=2 Tax=Pseudonocardia TaxID=1847 RepID=A0A1Y2N849_PSEAH|nr:MULTISPECIES: siderophore-interacting protein [Pseudonocardia]OSY43642.1 Vibriobactin utilization protein ViuB [Pseudonocardia autotrophica]TDN73368.1 NADPH-dependent ferric siderophore reductase [Pseudonocardia autotrophica]BBG04106.1 siderophore-interacting protein [Pseudonocardia autotrophica]GEC26243.1 siderophore-interacting protein [Pseudonocardia saturnea]